MRHAISLLPLLLACRPIPPAPVQVVTGREPALDSAEAPHLAKDAGTGVRNGDTLTITLANGERMTFVDDTSSVDHWVRYVYLGKIPGTSFMHVDAGFYEGGVSLLVDGTTGKKTMVDDAPTFSPSGRLVAVPSMDLEAGYDPNRLTLYMTAGDSLTQVWRIDSISWGPDSVAWHGEDSLFVRRAFLAEADLTYAYRDAWVVRGPDGWRMVE